MVRVYVAERDPSLLNVSVVMVLMMADEIVACARSTLPLTLL